MDFRSSYDILPPLCLNINLTQTNVWALVKVRPQPPGCILLNFFNRIEQVLRQSVISYRAIAEFKLRVLPLITFLGGADCKIYDFVNVTKLIVCK